MLVDAGNNDDGSVILDTLSAAGVAHLDYAVGTHGHEDHIGAMDDVLRTVDTDYLLCRRRKAIRKRTGTFLPRRRKPVWNSVLPLRVNLFSREAE